MVACPRVDRMSARRRCLVVEGTSRLTVDSSILAIRKHLVSSSPCARQPYDLIITSAVAQSARARPTPSSVHYGACVFISLGISAHPRTSSRFGPVGREGAGVSTCMPTLPGRLLDSDLADEEPSAIKRNQSHFGRLLDSDLAAGDHGAVHSGHRGIRGRHLGVADEPEAFTHARVLI